MKSTRTFAMIAAAIFAATTLRAASLETLHKHCLISPSRDAGKLSLRIDDGDCPGTRHCGSNFSTESLSLLTGISIADLAREGSHLTATLAAEAGTFTCTGAVSDSSLEGDAVFTPNPVFVSRMEQMGFTGFDSEKLMACALLNVETDWVRSVQQTGIHGMTTDNIIALRIFNVDPDYIRGITALGYDLPTAEQLIGLRVQGVNAQEVREIRALGYQPTLDEL